MLTGGKRDPGAPWRASLKEGILKGSFVSEEGIRLHLFVPVNPKLGALDEKGWGVVLRGQNCRSKKLAPLFLQ